MNSLPSDLNTHRRYRPTAIPSHKRRPQTHPEPRSPLNARIPQSTNGGAFSFQFIVIWVLPRFHSRPCAHMMTHQTHTGPAITTALLAIASPSSKNAVPSIVTVVRRNQPLTSLFVSSSHLVGRITPTRACTTATRTSHIWGSRIVSITLLILHVPAEHASQGCHAPEDQGGHGGG